MTSEPPDLNPTKRHEDDASRTLVRGDREEAVGGAPTLAHTMARTRAQTAAGNPLVIAAGTIIGRFRIESQIGRGGMGSVYSAVDSLKLEARNPNPYVAIKVLNADFRAHPDSFVALEREASKAQALAHPNIVTVFDFDRFDETAFVTMELLKGESLDTRIRGMPRGMPRAVALPIIRGVTHGLAHAHKKGVVHSDLKPANVFVLEDGTPKILDFGIARAVSESTAAARDEFDAGRLGAYTEAYATREMIVGGSPAPADDLYALAVMVCEMLSGAHPYGGLSAVEAQMSGRKPVLPTALRRHERRLISRCLSFDRARRPRDATEFGRLLAGVGVWVQAAAMAVVLLTLVAGYLSYRAYQATGPRVPLEQLDPATRQLVRSELLQGEQAWQFYRQGIGPALDDALKHYSRAYSAHEGDRDAARGLRRTADEYLKLARNKPSELLDTAKHLSLASPYLNSYPPVADALTK